jgi:hypothetical protein
VCAAVKLFVLVGVLKVTDENSRIRMSWLEVQIWICTKMPQHWF